MTIPEDYIPFILSDVDVFLKKDGSVFVNTKSGYYRIDGFSHQKYAWVISNIDGRRSIAQISSSLNLASDIVEFTSICIDLHGKLIGLRNRNDEVIVPEHENHPSNQSGELPSIIHDYGKTEFSSVGILGGGTAGYLTALALRIKHPTLKITLIESSGIPVIGVGEATTPLIIDFLHKYLNLDIVDFYRSVRPTWKLGIKFLWGQPSPFSFINPFGTDDLLMSELKDGHLNNSTLESMLISHEKGMIVQQDSDNPESIMDKVGYAYHLDNKLFLAYLKQKIKTAGITMIDERIKGFDLDPENGEISALINEQGKKINFDLYVDCSGFRSFLLGGALQSKFISFRSSLMTDTAITGILENPVHIPPYTLAETMEHGWNWQIPLRDEHHRGYVFSSDFCNEDQAWEEMVRLNPEIKNPVTVKFMSGKMESFWLKNVVGIGNAYGFVEPLESTGIHMIIEEIKMLSDNFPVRKSDYAIRKIINEKISLQWDYLRWYLAVHYKFNHRLQTPFWQECQRKTDISGVQDLIDLYQEEGPLYLRSKINPQLLRPFFHDSVFGPFGFDYILVGQKVPFRAKFKPFSNQDQWINKKNRQSNLLQMAVDQKSALALIEKYPELLKF